MQGEASGGGQQGTDKDSSRPSVNKDRREEGIVGEGRRAGGSRREQERTGESRREQERAGEGRRGQTGGGEVRVCSWEVRVPKLGELM